MLLVHYTPWCMQLQNRAFCAVPLFRRSVKSSLLCLTQIWGFRLKSVPNSGFHSFLLPFREKSFWSSLHWFTMNGMSEPHKNSDNNGQYSLPSRVHTTVWKSIHQTGQQIAGDFEYLYLCMVVKSPQCFSLHRPPFMCTVRDLTKFTICWDILIKPVLQYDWVTQRRIMSLTFDQFILGQNETLLAFLNWSSCGMCGVHLYPSLWKCHQTRTFRHDSKDEVTVHLTT